VVEAFRCGTNWVQLVKFAIVGDSVVNLAVYVLLLKEAGLQYVARATGLFQLAPSRNYLWNPTWTFRAQRSNFGIQGMRFFVLSATVYDANIGVPALASHQPRTPLQNDSASHHAFNAGSTTEREQW